MTALHPRIVSCKVLALEGSDRLEGFFERPGSEHFEVFRATDGRKGEGEGLFDREAFRTRYEREPSLGEIGCAVSHYRMLREFAKSRGADCDLMLVAEDDARLSRDAERILNRIASRVKRVDFGLLAHPSARAGTSHVIEFSRRSIRLSIFSYPLGWGGLTIYRFGFADGFFCGTGLYLVSRAAARRYVEYVQMAGRLAWVADDYAVVAEGAGNQIGFLRPGIADWAGGTTIQSIPNSVFPGVGGSILKRTRLAISPRMRIREFRGVLLATKRHFSWGRSGVNEVAEYGGGIRD